MVGDLERARNNEECGLTLYFTKESHIHTLVNLVLHSGLPGRFWQDVTVANEYDVLSAEFLFQFANDSRLNFLELRPLGHRHVDDDRLKQSESIYANTALRFVMCSVACAMCKLHYSYLFAE